MQSLFTVGARRAPLFLSLFATACGLAMLAGCNPTFNWREVRPEGANLVLLLPCKPDHTTRAVTMGTVAMDLHMTGCETGGALFVVTYAERGAEPAPANPPEAPGKSAKPVANNAELLAQWRAATLAHLHAPATSAVPFALAGAAPALPAERMSAVGQRPDGKRVETQAVYFAYGPRLYQVAVYADRIAPEVADNFFTGLKLQ